MIPSAKIHLIPVSFQHFNISILPLRGEGVARNSLLPETGKVLTLSPASNLIYCPARTFPAWTGSCGTQNNILETIFLSVKNGCDIHKLLHITGFDSLINDIKNNNRSLLSQSHQHSGGEIQHPRLHLHLLQPNPCMAPHDNVVRHGINERYLGSQEVLSCAGLNLPVSFQQSFHIYFNKRSGWPCTRVGFQQLLLSLIELAMKVKLFGVLSASCSVIPESTAYWTASLWMQKWMTSFMTIIHLICPLLLNGITGILVNPPGNQILYPAIRIRLHVAPNIRPDTTCASVTRQHIQEHVLREMGQLIESDVTDLRYPSRIADHHLARCGRTSALPHRQISMQFRRLPRVGIGTCPKIF